MQLTLQQQQNAVMQRDLQQLAVFSQRVQRQKQLEQIINTLRKSFALDLLRTNCLKER